MDKQTILAIVGKMPDEASAFYQKMQANKVKIITVDTIPNDKRHRSKVDYVMLKNKVKTKLK